MLYPRPGESQESWEARVAKEEKRLLLEAGAKTETADWLSKYPTANTGETEVLERARLALRNCGTGAGGFQPGNTCAKGGDGNDAPNGDSEQQNQPLDINGLPLDLWEKQFDLARKMENKKLANLRRKVVEAKEKWEKKFAESMARKSEAREAYDRSNELLAQQQEVLDHAMRAAELNPTQEQKSKAEEEQKRFDQLDKENSKYLRAAIAAHEEMESTREKMRSAAYKVLRREMLMVCNEKGWTTKEVNDRINLIQETQKAGVFQSPSNDPELSRSDVAKRELSEANEFLNLVCNPMIHRNALENTIIRYSKYEPGFRAHANEGRPEDGGGVGSITIAPGVGTTTVVHEYGHQLEFGDLETKVLCNGFLDKRTRGEETVRMKTLGDWYTEDEIGCVDDFKAATAAAFRARGETADEVAVTRLAAYSGKRYGTSPSGFTEVLSMGIERLRDDPASFATADPEWFDLVAGVVTGRLIRGGRKPETPSTGS